MTFLRPENLADYFGKSSFHTPLDLKYEGQLHDYQDEKSIVTQTIFRNKQEVNKNFLRLLRAGPRLELFFNPSEVKACIVTCGGLCPGINNVIKGLTQMLIEYGVNEVYGIKGGYNGFPIRKNWIKLDRDTVKTIHKQGGSILVCDRGNPKIEICADAIMKEGINMIFIIGGDGTHRGAEKLHRHLIETKGYKCSVVGIPKTIDNDIPIIDGSFGFSTAVSQAVKAIHAAYTEAVGAPNCVGLVKLMGRNSGLVVLHAVIASAVCDIALLPEMDIDKDKLLCLIRDRIESKGSCVVVVAEGCGSSRNSLMKAVDTFDRGTDAGGNEKLMDVGSWLKDNIIQYAKDNDLRSWTVKYIDPTYMIRAVPANTEDSTFCHVLAHNAVHGAMAGYTGFSCSKVDSRYVMLPFTALSKPGSRQVNLAGRWFARMVMYTGQTSVAPTGSVYRHSSHNTS